MPAFKASTDYYVVLDIRAGADGAEIKKVYRKLSFLQHPDKNGGSQESTTKFQSLTEAYTVLSDQAVKQQWELARRIFLASRHLSGKVNSRVSKTKPPASSSNSSTKLKPFTSFSKGKKWEDDSSEKSKPAPKPKFAKPASSTAYGWSTYTENPFVSFSKPSFNFPGPQSGPIPSYRESYERGAPPPPPPPQQPTASSLKPRITRQPTETKPEPSTKPTPFKQASFTPSEKKGIPAASSSTKAPLKPSTASKRRAMPPCPPSPRFYAVKAIIELAEKEIEAMKARLIAAEGKKVAAEAELKASETRHQRRTAEKQAKWDAEQAKREAQEVEKDGEDEEEKQLPRHEQKKKPAATPMAGTFDKDGNFKEQKARSAGVRKSTRRPGVSPFMDNIKRHFGK